MVSNQQNHRLPTSGARLAVNGGSPVRPAPLTFAPPDIREEDIAEVVDTLESGWLVTGPKVHRFEQEFAAYLGMPYAVGLTSCTAALALSLELVGVGPGDEVIVTPNTFVSTVTTITERGGVPVFVDIDPETYNMDHARVAEAVTERTKAVIAVHYAGRPCRMEMLRNICDTRGIALISDAAHAIEARIGSQSVAQFSDISCYSFHAVKNLTTGEGGMLVTMDTDWCKRLKPLRLCGLTKDAFARYGQGKADYDVLEPGYKCNMMDIQAALGLGQLRRLEANHLRRRQIWDAYDEAFREIEGLTIPPKEDPGTRHARHLYNMLVNPELIYGGKQAFVSAMQAEGIATSAHFRPIPSFSMFNQGDVSWRGSFDNAARFYERTVSLPLTTRLTEDDVNDVIQAALKVAHGLRT